MNWLDITIITCIGIGLIKGLFDGLIKQVVSLVGLILAILFAGRAATYLYIIFNQWSFIPGNWNYPVCYAISFILILIVMALLGYLLNKIWELTTLGFLNKLAGGIAGSLISILCLSLLLNALVVFDGDSRIISKQDKMESSLFEGVREVVPFIYPYIREKVQESIEKKELTFNVDVI